MYLIYTQIVAEYNFNCLFIPLDNNVLYWIGIKILFQYH